MLTEDFLRVELGEPRHFLAQHGDLCRSEQIGEDQKSVALVVVFDVSEAAMEPLLLRQAKRAASPRGLADQCEIVAVSLPTLTAFRAAVLGPEGLVAGRAIKVLLNTCTVGVPFLREIEAALVPKGIAIIDCPISGGPAGARAGTLSVMVSGDPAAVEKLRPLISLWGPTLTVAGDKPGAAQVLKLTNNILFAVSLAATSEAFVIGRQEWAGSRGDGQ